METFKPKPGTIEIDNSDFKLSRSKGIGGSDFENLLQESAYSCIRKLFYEKSGREPDYKSSGEFRLSRGHRQEPVARAYFEEKTGIKVFKPSCAYAIEKSPFLRVNVDGLFEKDGKLGVLEIKTLGVDSFQKIKKQGLPSHYVAQAQWGAGILQGELTSYAIFSPEKDELLTLDVPFNSEAFNTLTKLASDYWFTYSSLFNRDADSAISETNESHRLPGRLDIESTACQYCVFRKTCQGLNSRGANTLEF